MLARPRSSLVSYSVFGWSLGHCVPSSGGLVFGFEEEETLWVDISGSIGAAPPSWFWLWLCLLGFGRALAFIGSRGAALKNNKAAYG